MPRKSTPAAAAPATKIEDVVELLHELDIADLVFHEERGRRLSWTERERETLTFPITDNSLGILSEPTTLRFRFRAVFADLNGEYVADVEIVYASERPFETSDAVQYEFAERVAFMAAYPFIRSSIHGSAIRLGLPAPILAMVRQGEFSLGDKMDEQAVVKAFGDIRSEFAEPDPS